MSNHIDRETKMNGLSDFKADFGFNPPLRTRRQCPRPEFIDKHLHRIAIMKDEYWASGLPGWTTKHVCTGCGREWGGGGFRPSKEAPND